MKNITLTAAILFSLLANAARAADTHTETIYPNDRHYIGKTVTGTVTGTGESMDSLYSFYDASGNAGGYTSMGSPFAARTDVGFNAALRGTVVGPSSLMDIQSVDGSGDSEVAGFYGFVNAWGAYSQHNISEQGFDLSVKGPTATQANRPNLLTGFSLALNNMAPQGPITGAKRGAKGMMMAAVIGQSVQEASWTGETSYPWDDGFQVAGWSGLYGTATDGTSAAATNSFDKAFHAGGTGGGIMMGGQRSRIGEGFYAEDYVTNGFHATNPNPYFSGAGFLSDQGAGGFSYGKAVPDAPLHIAVDGVSEGILEASTQNSTLHLRRSQGSIASKADVTGGQIGSFIFEGWKTGAWQNAAQIASAIQSVGTGYVNGDLEFNVSNNGASQEVMQILPGGVFLGGNASGASTVVSTVPNVCNFFQFVGAATGASPYLAVGSTCDANPAFNYVLKGSGGLNVFGFGGATVLVNFNSIASATSSLQLSNGVGSAAVGSSAGDLNLTPASGKVDINGTAGVSCSGAPTAAFTVTGGIVTHC